VKVAKVVMITMMTTEAWQCRQKIQPKFPRALLELRQWLRDQEQLQLMLLRSPPLLLLPLPRPHHLT
jgi:hypothetical protein